MYLCILLILVLNVYKASGNKYCSLESNGEPKYFICARNEYCCHFGCCVHLAFQFYQLWYYWLLLIFMFMLCSGGSWWYKFCRHHETSTYPSLPPSFERQTRQTIVDSRRNRSVDRNTADNSFYFQRIWKANGMGPPPNYYTASVVRYHSASELETRRQQQECPYYQLYGPPPSYESVVRIPENGYGQPSCTLVPTTIPHQATNITNNNNINNNNSSSTGGSGHIVIDTPQNPIPSTSVQNDFVSLPLHTSIINDHSIQPCTSININNTTSFTDDGNTVQNRNASTSNIEKHLVTSVLLADDFEPITMTTKSTSATTTKTTPATDIKCDSELTPLDRLRHGDQV